MYTAVHTCVVIHVDKSVSCGESTNVYFPPPNGIALTSSSDMHDIIIIFDRFCWKVENTTLDGNRLIIFMFCKLLSMFTPRDLTSRERELRSRRWWLCHGAGLGFTTLLYFTEIVENAI